MERVRPACDGGAGRMGGGGCLQASSCPPPNPNPSLTPAIQTPTPYPACSLGVAGVAMDVRLLVCKFIWDDGFGSISDALECLRLCADEGATISSNSWGGVPHSSECAAAIWGAWGMGGWAEAGGLRALPAPACPPARCPVPPANSSRPRPCPHPAHRPRPTEAIQAALQEMEMAGMLFVVASGNQGVDLDARPAFPASAK